MLALTFITALGCGLNAGIFYAFSSFIMKALGNLPPAQGIAAMQRVNLDVINPWFMVVFMGTAGTSIALIVTSVWHWDEVDTPWGLAGALLYLLGTFGVTIAFNVPLNNRLAALEPDAPGAGEVWSHYLKVWTAWNTIRTAAGLAACIALILAMR